MSKVKRKFSLVQVLRVGCRSNFIRTSRYSGRVFGASEEPGLGKCIKPLDTNRLLVW